MRGLGLRLGLGLAVLAVLGFVIARLVAERPSPTVAPSIQARLDLAAGEVTVERAGATVVAHSDTPLLADSRVVTAQGARAWIRLPDGASLFLRDSTEIELGGAGVALERGEVWLDAPLAERQALSHRAGEVTLSAAEAGLSVRREGATVTVYVARGRATVQGVGGRVDVAAGEQVTIVGPAAPRVEAVTFWDDWTGGMADFDSGQEIPGEGAGTLYGVDTGAAAGSPALPLELAKQAVRATVRQGLSETEVDQTFFNPGERAVEGWYWFTVPARASVTGFAVETNGQLVEGEFQERREASGQYDTAKSTGHSPAILEWVDERTYRARIFPIQPGASRRVVLRYVELRPLVDGKVSYVYPLGSRAPTRIGEFSLSVDLGPEGERMRLATLADARVEENGRRVTMRRSGYTPRAPFQLEATMSQPGPPLTVARFAGGGESADYVLLRYVPDVDWEQLAPPRGDVVVVVDTSAAGDESSRRLKAATAEAILRALSDEDRFALIALDAKPTVMHPAQGLAPASGAEIARALERLAEHGSGGATDLAASFDVALRRLHGTEQPAVVYVGDGVATSGAMTGEQLAERLRRALSSSRARLFTVGVGVDADHALLGELARAGGGTAFRVEQSEATTAQALELAAALKVPTITELEIDLGAGLDEPFSSANGKLSRGNEVLVLARTHHELPAEIVVTGRIGAQDFRRRYPTRSSSPLLSAFVPRLWAAEHVRRLLGAAGGAEQERGRIAALGLTYGLMTPHTSIIALESEAAYDKLGIPRRPSKLRGIRLGALDAATAATSRVGVASPGTVPAAAFGCSRTERTASDEASPAEAVAPDVEEGVAGPMPAVDGVVAVERSDSPVMKTETELMKTAPPLAAPPPESLAGLGPLAAGPGDEPGGEASPQRPTSMARTRGGVARGPSVAKPTPSAPEATEAREATPPRTRRDPGTCSDAASRPLAQRVLLWRQRLRPARSAPELLARYEAARVACELTDWHAERSFLALMQQSIGTEGDARAVLAHFGGRPEVKRYLAQLILRRAVEPRLVAAVEGELFGRAVDWAALDRELSAIAEPEVRLTRLREAMVKAPRDPNGDMRLVRLLVELGQHDEALALGRRLRDQGTLTPNLAQQLGNVLAAAGLAEEAVRTYSEIVEFDPQSLASRRLLGDIFLGHGWYAPAYLQYATLTEVAAADALAWLRMAAAAAGAGRVDEALRLERKVASAQGNPGPSDPRRWARAMSAARLARLLAEPAGVEAGPDSNQRRARLQRELKELQLFSGPGTWILLTWEELAADLLLTVELEGRDQALGEVIDAAPIGLSAMLLSTADADEVRLRARVRSVPLERQVKLWRQQIGWDGKEFRVIVTEHHLAPRAASAEL